MKRCPMCHRDVPDYARMCPYPDCARPLTGIGGTPGSIPPPPPPPGMAPSAMSPPGPPQIGSHNAPGLAPPPPPPGMWSAPAPQVPASPLAPPPPPGSARTAANGIPPPPPGITSLASLPLPNFSSAAPAGSPVSVAPAHLSEEVQGLERRVRVGRRRSVLLGAGAAAAVALGLLCWLAYYASAVWSYARIDDLQLQRVPGEADRLALVYRAQSRGKVGFLHAIGDRETELLDRIGGDEVGQAKDFQWRVSGLQPGNVIKVTSLDGWSLRTTELRVPDDGLLSGQVVNAINRDPVPDALVRIVGTQLSARTDAEGAFRITGAPGGNKSIEISAKGFTTETLERRLADGRETSIRLALNPGLQEGQIRIVLTWGKQPKDLDAHLEGPLPNDEKFHVYYHQQGDLKSKEYVRLDVDAQNGEGPETITVLGVVPGTYRYFVHDYSHRDDPDSRALAESEAEVKVYQGGQMHRFTAGHDMPGNVWDVFQIEVTPQGAVVKKADKYQGLKLESMGLYAKRTQGNREQWIGNYGGNAASEKAVADGLQWLARHQGADGAWTNKCLDMHPESRCEKDVPCTGDGENYEMAHTGLTLLAFQAAGNYYFNDTPYSNQVAKALDWLVEHQREDGGLVGSRTPKKKNATYHQFYMYEHGIATFALADACAAAAAMRQPANEKYLDALRKAVDFIVQNQHDDGGWRYDNRKVSESDSSVSGWQVLALKSAKEAGVFVDSTCIEKVREFFKGLEKPETGQTKYVRRQIRTEATTGVGMLAKQFLLDEPDAPLVKKAAEHLANYAEKKWPDRRATGSDLDFYLWYNCTLGMFQAGTETWNRWNNLVRDTIVGLQRHGDQCVRGSWDPDVYGKPGGRIYSTALAVLTLEVYYRYTQQGEIRASEMDMLDITRRGHEPGGHDERGANVEEDDGRPAAPGKDKEKPDRPAKKAKKKPAR